MNIERKKVCITKKIIIFSAGLQYRVKFGINLKDWVYIVKKHFLFTITLICKNIFAACYKDLTNKFS